LTEDGDRILKSLRAMAWERAKGELQAALSTFWPEYASGSLKEADNGFEAAERMVKQFIKKVEDDGIFV
jgi:hypothetical protein